MRWQGASGEGPIDNPSRLPPQVDINTFIYANHMYLFLGSLVLEWPQRDMRPGVGGGGTRREGSMYSALREPLL